MKHRILSLILAVVMTVSLFTFTAYAEEKINNVKEGTIASELLLALGIVHEYNDDPLDLEAETTRAEFVSMIAALMRGGVNDGVVITTDEDNRKYKVETEEVKVSEEFHDVTILHWGYDDIEYLRALGMLNGYDNGYFYPDETISLNEATKLLVKALGYDFMAEAKGGYPDGYTAVARNIKLFDNIIKRGNETVTNADSFILIYNALNTGAMQVDSVNGNYHVVKDGYSILNDSFGVYEIEGKVTATHISGLYSAEDRTDNGFIQIGDRLFKTEKDYSSYLGHKVKAYVSYDEENKERGSLFVLSPLTKEESITVLLKDVIGLTTEGNTYHLEVYVDDDEVTLKINTEADILTGGVAYGRNLSEDILENEIGSITLVKWANTYELVKIDTYVPMFVESVDYEGKKVKGYSYYEGTGIVEESLNLDDKDKAVFLRTMKNEETDIEAVEKGCVIYVSRWENTLTVTVGGMTDSGKITRVSKNKVYIEGYEYTSLENVYDYRLNSEILAGLTKEDEIFYAEDTVNKQSGYNYGLLMDVHSEEELFEEVFYVKMMTKDGKISVFELSEKMKLTDSEGYVRRYNGEGENGITADEIKASLIYTAHFAGISASKVYPAEPTEYRKYEQVVKFKTDSEGKISEILLARKSTSVPYGEKKSDYFTVENVDIRDYTTGYIYGGKVPNTPYNVGSSLCFNVSKNTTNKPADSEYIVKAIGGDNHGSNHGLVMFDVDEAGKAGCVITGSAWGKNSVNQGFNYTNLVFGGMEEVVMEHEDNIVNGYEITVLSGSSKNILYATENCGNNYDYLVHAKNYKVGDVFNPVYWASGYFYGVYDNTYHSVSDFLGAIIAYNETGNKSGAFHNVKGNTIYSSYEYEEVFGEVRYAEGKNIVIGYGSDYAESISSAISDKVIRYDCETGYVKVVDASSIEEGDWAFMQLYNYNYRMLMVFANTDAADLSVIKDINEWN